MNYETIQILDFESPFRQQLARRLREQQVYCEVHPYTADLAELRPGCRGIILSGGPTAQELDGAAAVVLKLIGWNVPLLAIGGGATLLTKVLGGQVGPLKKREHGETAIELNDQAELFLNLKAANTVWMEEGSCIQEMPPGFWKTAATAHCPIAAMENIAARQYALQFHPELRLTPQGDRILENFLFQVCGLSGDWQLDDFIRDQIEKIKVTTKDKRVISGMSGGVDSSVSSLLVHRAIGERLTCIFVDHGLLRKNEGDEVERIFKKRFKMNLIRVDARERFLSKLEGVSEPEEKRRIIGEEFIRVFEEEARKLDDAAFLVQGTIYPDVIESGAGSNALVKSHHNVGGLPEDMDFRLIEPLRSLFKDEVRKVGIELGIPQDLVWRQPFPGPGLGIRIIGEITEEKLSVLREADHIFREEIAKASLTRDLNQYFTVLTGIRSVGVTSGARTYDHTIALRAVTTTDFMTAEWARIPYDILDRISSRIVNEVSGVNRVVYDVTNKPPATIEWE